MAEISQKDILLGTAREIYGRLVYTHKTHEKDREIWSKRVVAVRCVNVILSALTVMSIVGGIFLTSNWALIIGAVFASLTTAFVIFQLSFNPAEIRQEHRLAAKRLLTVRDKFLLLIEKLNSESVPLDEGRSELTLLTKEVDSIYENVPDTSSRAYGKAREGLKKKEEYTFSDDEIDQFLPEVLRKTEHD